MPSTIRHLNYEIRLQIIYTLAKLIKKIEYFLVSIIAPEKLKLSIKNVSLCVNGDQCNLNCIMCWHTYDRKKKNENYQAFNLSRENLFQIINDEDLKNSIISLVGGGEPFLYPYIGEFLQEATKNHRRIMIMTNGTLIQNNQVFWEIAKNAAITLMFSIDSATQFTYEKIRLGGNWSILNENIERFIKLRETNPLLDLSTSFVVLKQNLHELLDFLRLNKKWGSTYIHIHPALSAGFPEEWRIDPNNPEYQRVISQAIEFLQQNGIATDSMNEMLPADYLDNLQVKPSEEVKKRNLYSVTRLFDGWKIQSRDPRKSCKIHSESMTVSTTGDIFLCDSAFRIGYHCGNIFRENISTLWLSNKWLSVRIFHLLGFPNLHPLCRSCLLVQQKV